jgi:hypothetical protein
MKYCALNNELPFNVLFELKDEKHKSARSLCRRPIGLEHLRQRTLRTCGYHMLHTIHAIVLIMAYVAIPYLLSDYASLEYHI